MPRPLNFPQKSFPEPFKLDRVARIEAKKQRRFSPPYATLTRRWWGWEFCLLFLHLWNETESAIQRFWYSLFPITVYPRGEIEAIWTPFHENGNINTWNTCLVFRTWNLDTPDMRHHSECAGFEPSPLTPKASTLSSTPVSLELSPRRAVGCPGHSRCSLLI